MFAGLCLVAHAESSSESLLESAAEALLQLASDFSPRYEMVRPHLVVVDIGGLGRLLGTPREIGEAFCLSARERGLTVAIGIASTQTTALLLALHQTMTHRATSASDVRDTRDTPVAAVEPAKLADARASAAHAHAERLTVVRPGREASALAPLPLSLLTVLPSDRLTNDDVAFLRRRPDPSSFAPSSPSSSSSTLPAQTGVGGATGTFGAAGAAGAAAKGNAPGMPSRGAVSTRGKTRGKRGRGGAMNYRLAPSPMQSAERADEAVLDVLRRWGLKTLGEFAALPADALFERLGREGLELQEVARGRDARPLVPTIAGEPYEASLALEWPIEELEPLSFVLTRLFEPLCARLERCDRGAAVLHVSLQLVSRECYARRLELPAPMRDPKVLRTLVLLDLESHPPNAGIDRVTLTIEPTPGRIIQHSLLTRPLPSPEQLSTLTARLTAVMGDNHVGAPVLVDTHRPEAFDMQRFHVPVPSREVLLSPLPDASSGGAAATAMAGMRFVLRRFRRPIPARVRVEHDRPVHVAPQGLRGGAVIQAAGPWRTSGDWWKSRPRLHPSNAPGASPEPARPRRTSSSWNRDEWDVALADGCLYRIHLDHGQNRWFVEASLD
jgi:protein ImuB